MTYYSINTLERTVVAICHRLQKSIAWRQVRIECEVLLRKELISCIIGSQIRFETAKAIMRNFNYLGVLDDIVWYNATNEEFKMLVASVLSNTRCGMPCSAAHRFPKLNTERIVALHCLLRSHSLYQLLTQSENIKDIRKYLVKFIPGLGPKQASMFIRNANYSENLAILDIHLLRFIDMIGVYSNPSIASLSKYEQVEESFCGYAEELHVSPGVLDMAIWATMRAASESPR